ncbi:hypothetical protein [Ectopseudomonas oleovorans]|uniref:hypothetical protein n=1 Tax=Ectopseudomonas oleovorans TaxID=301 RepID=UPI0035B0394E
MPYKMLFSALLLLLSGCAVYGEGYDRGYHHGHDHRYRDGYKHQQPRHDYRRDQRRQEHRSGQIQRGWEAGSNTQHRFSNGRSNNEQRRSGERRW